MNHSEIQSFFDPMKKNLKNAVLMAQLLGINNHSTIYNFSLGGSKSVYNIQNRKTGETNTIAYNYSRDAELQTIMLNIFQPISKETENDFYALISIETLAYLKNEIEQTEVRPSGLNVSFIDQVLAKDYYLDDQLIVKFSLK